MKRIDHVQVAIPPGGEAVARRFYVNVLGFTELAKPPAMAARGGAWFRRDEIELHVGVDPDFLPATRAHPGLSWDGVEELAQQLTEAGFAIQWDAGIEDRRRFHTLDPFGNRLEFLEDGG